MTWRMARSLEVLLQQLNAMYPLRDKASDGGIGDAAHASRNSDHNPWYQANTGVGIVTARDFTHDPNGGINCHSLAKWLSSNGDRRVKYIIWDRRIWDREDGWAPYYGVNPHTKHLHLSVVASVLCDDTRPWKLSLTAPEEDDMPSLNELLSTRLGNDATTALKAYADKPGTFGHWLLNQQSDNDAARKYGQTANAKLDKLLTLIEGLQ
jgi:hypothetical protein